MKKVPYLFGFIFLILLAAPAMAEMTLSEIMFDPLGNENYDEFIEIYNTGPDSVDLSGWQISDGSAIDLLQPVENSKMKLAPGAFAIVLDPGYFGNSTAYDALIPATTLRLTIDNNTFGSGGLSNSTSKNIQLLDAAGIAVSAYQYSLGNENGFSDEKIDLAGPNSAENWADAQTLNGTPGFANSVAPVTFDLKILSDQITLTPQFPVTGESVQIRVPVFNNGRQPADNFEVVIFFDENRNAIFEPAEAFNRQNNTSVLSFGDSVYFDFTWENLPQGTHALQASVSFQADENLANNLALFQVVVTGTSPAVLINEIMFRPISGEPEWFEIFNSGSEGVNLRNWQFSDSRVSSKILITSDDFWLAPNGFAVVAANNSLTDKFPETDSLLLVPKTFSALNNEGDAVVIWDELGRQIDTVRYQPEWGGETGISLERKSPEASSNLPESWGSSQAGAGATPGARNSWLPPDFDLAISEMRISPARVVAPAEILVDLEIKNSGLNFLAGFEVLLFEDTNENQQIDAGESATSFSGGGLAVGDSTEIQARLEIFTPGVHFFGAILTTERDERAENNLLWQTFAAGFPQKSLVINEIMYKSMKGQAEWIEFLNPTEQVISLRNWLLTDSEFQHRVTLTDENLEIEPGQFLIVANDAAFFQQFPAVICPVLIRTDLPVLNNDTDEIVLMDCAEFTIDSLLYTSSWAPETGISLERVFWRWNSVNPTSWQPSVAPAGATPGAPNSVEALDFDLAFFPGAIHVLNNPLRYRDSIRVALKIENLGKEPVQAFGVNFFNNPVGDSLPGDAVARFTVDETIGTGDSLKMTFSLPPSTPGIRWLMGEIDLPEDTFTADNITLANLKIGFPAGSLVINEIMYSPFAGQVEWIEVYNPGNMPVDASEWQISDNDTNSKVSLLRENRLIPPEGFAIITGDSSFLDDWPEVQAPVFFTAKSFPSLNNEDEQVWLFDVIGSPLDSVFYLSAWGGETGISLERINPAISSREKSNWNSCVFFKGGSPGVQNSIWIDALPAQAGLTVSPDPFSPDNDGFDDFTAISYELPLETSRVNLKIFDVRGRLIRTLLNAAPSGAQRTILWDGRDDQTQLARMGIYVIYLEALNEFQGSLTKITKTVVLANQLD